MARPPQQHILKLQTIPVAVLEAQRQRARKESSYRVLAQKSEYLLFSGRESRRECLQIIEPL